MISLLLGMLVYWVPTREGYIYFLKIQLIKNVPRATKVQT